MNTPTFIGPLSAALICSTFKTGDVLPLFEATLYDAGVPAYLGTPDSITFSMRHSNDPTVLATGAASLNDGTPGGIVYAWAPGDLTLDGPMFAEVVVRWGADVATFPDDSYMLLTVLPAI